MHRTVLTYPKPLIRRAVHSFLWRAVGFYLLVALTMVAIGFVVSIRRGDTSWFVGVLGTVFVLGMAFLLALYRAHYRTDLDALKRMGSDKATLEAGEAFLSFSSGAGTSSLPWTKVTEVWQFKTYWLLFVSNPKSRYLIVPLADMPADMAAFMLSRVQAAGGKLRQY